MYYGASEEDIHKQDKSSRSPEIYVEVLMNLSGVHKLTSPRVSESEDPGISDPLNR